jgi:hypothetical protein
MRTGIAALIPREHGAWAMLITAFAAGLALARGVSWLTLASAGAALAAFLLRDSLVILFRQAWIWKQPHAESTPARWLVLALGATLAGCGAALISVRSWPVLAAFGAGAGLLTAAAVILTVRNRQRSPWMQVAVAIGLNAAAPAAWISVRTDFSPALWWLWAMLSVNSVAGVLTVHARLAAKHAQKTHDLEFVAQARWAAGIAIAAIVVAAATGAMRTPWLVLIGAVSAAVYTFDLVRLRRVDELSVPLRRVGLRAMFFSTLYAAAVVMCLATTAPASA